MGTLADKVEGLATGIDTAKKMLEAKGDLSKAQVEAELAVVMSGMARAQIALSQTELDLHAKDVEIKRLQDALESKGDLVKR